MTTVTQEYKREVWSKPIELVLSLIGCAVGFGNVWRYPYIAYQNGGGAFLIPYFVMYILLGLPLYYLQMCLGQFTSVSLLKLFRFSRLWKGVGWCMVLQAFTTSIYYNMIIAWVLFYLFACFRKRLLWSSCGNTWNTAACRTMDQMASNTTQFCRESSNISGKCIAGKLAAAEYFDRYVLEKSDAFENFGMPTWKLSLCLLLAWILVYVCVRQGIKSSGKVVYVTALFPYVVIFALIIRGVTLPGSSKGLHFYFLPKWSKMKDIRVWISATIQVMFSLGLASGTIINYSSFSTFKHKFERGVLVVILFDCFTSVLSGIAIFSVLGFMADKFNLPIHQVVQSGPGLAFIAYPEAMARMPLGHFWSISFFLMMITLGLDSQFALIDVIVTSVLDTWPRFRAHQSLFTLFLCIFCYLLTLPMCAPGGIYYFTLLNEFSANLSSLLCSLIIIIIIIYIYGFNNLMQDIAMMLDRRTFEPYLCITWCITTPIILLIIFLSMLLGFKAPSVGQYVFPLWACVLGGCITTLILSPILIIGIMQYIKAWRVTGEMVEKSICPHYLRAWYHALAPSRHWGPALAENRTGRYASSSSAALFITHF